MPNINLDDAYVLDETGAQVDKVTGLFTKNENATTGEKQMARLNIAAGGSNDNLLDNWYFVGGGSQLGDGIFPINQRGQTSYSDASNTIDRWKTENSSISVGADVLTWTATGDNGQFEQIIENYKLIEGETYTATIDCDILAGSARLFVGGVAYPWPTVAGSAVNVSSGITKVTFTFSRESGYTGQYKLALASVGSCTAKLRKFKLEKGTYSTLANDVRPDFGKELEKCKRYFQRVIQPQGYTSSVGFGMLGPSNNILRTTIPLSSPLRNATSIIATATNTGQMFVWGNGSYYSVTGVTGRTVLNGNAIVDITVNGTLENYKTYNLILNNANAYIDLSAEI